MRELTDSERDYLLAYWFTEPLGNSIAMPERFKEGFIAGLDHQQAQIAALQTQLRAESADNTRLREALENMLYIFDQGYDKADSLGQMRCDEARRALDNPT